MEWKSLFWHIFPSPRSLYQMQWNEKCFFSKETPSLKRFSQNRRLKRSSGFHRPEKSCSVDGTTSLEEVWKAEIFHPGRNYRCVDGVFSQKQLGKLPSFKRLVNIRCIGKKKVPKWAPSIRKFSWIRWYSFVTTASEGASRLSINPAPRPKLLRSSGLRRPKALRALSASRE